MSTDRITFGSCAVELMLGDITRIPVDAIVNAANASLSGGGGVDGAIHDAAGPTLMEELRQYHGCPTGSVVVTGAGRLPAKFVFHAVGPVYQGGHRHEPKLLASCYRNALKLAEQHNCASISFSSISTGVYGYPVSEAAAVAMATIFEMLPDLTCVTNIRLVQFNKIGLQVYQELFLQYSRQQSSAQTS